MKTKRQEFEEGWKHFCDCINFGASTLDAEAIEFMNNVDRLLDGIEEVEE